VRLEHEETLHRAGVETAPLRSKASISRDICPFGTPPMAGCKSLEPKCRSFNGLNKQCEEPCVTAASAASVPGMARRRPKMDVYCRERG